MTPSDDTKVDTNGWVAGSDRWIDDLSPERYNQQIAEFNKQCERDACLLAIQSLPKVTAERDVAVNQRDALSQLAWETAGQRDVALSEVSALSARVRELTEEISLAYQTNRDLSLSHTANLRRVMELEAMIVRLLNHHGAYIDALPGGYGVTDLKEARALIGKEPPK